MNARRKKAPPRAEASESTVYLGRDVVGCILDDQIGNLSATDAIGKSLGTFRTPRDAMNAIVAAARAQGRRA
jgi:hypothetical protein